MASQNVAVFGCRFVQVGLCVWDCGLWIVEVGLWFALDEKEEKSPERREEETEK